MISVIGDKNAVHEVGQASWASMPSTSPVNPRMSQNIMVMTSHLAAEHELFRVARQLRDVMRRHVAREGAADLVLAHLGAQVAEEVATR